ncbi:HTH domain-containing protein [Listeria rocourtiae]|uniref:helix-turn-helix domain-containing protein n=1 Tax=Listeria rocourtiae TaxID=647910 RepID=UPI00162552A5|nr:helix-turn-helix domain-containing protein [Listeria rocourtiae]MBC1435291.1 HTH domain-containing protein [Listeria rocourtiae]
MKDIHFELIIDKAVKREILILQMLNMADTPVSTLEIATKLDVSVKTIISDLQNIDNALPTGLKIKKKYNLYYLEKDKIGNEGINQFIIELLFESPLYKIINALIHGECVTVPDWAEQLFISEMSLKRYLASLKKILMGYNLKLKYTPSIEIRGSEVECRKFFFDVLHSHNSRFREKEEYDMLYSGLIEYAQSQEMSKVKLDYQRILSWLFIVEHRIQDSHYIQVPQEIISAVTDKDSFKIFANSYNHFLKSVLNINQVSVDEQVFAYVAILDTVTYTEHSSFKAINYRRFDQNAETEIEAFLKPVLTLFFDGIPLFYSVFESYISNILLLDKLTPLFEKNLEEIKEMVCENSLYIYKQWLLALENSSLNIVYKEDVATSLTMLTVAFKNATVSKQYHVAFVLSGESTYLSYLIALIRLKIPNVKVSFLLNQEPDATWITDTDVDLFVANFSMDTTLIEQRVFQLSYTPLERDWRELREIIIS